MRQGLVTEPKLVLNPQPNEICVGRKALPNTTAVQGPACPPAIGTYTRQWQARTHNSGHTAQLADHGSCSCGCVISKQHQLSLLGGSSDLTHSEEH